MRGTDLTDRLFAYGTLEDPEVVRALTGRSFPAIDARLTGFERYLLRGQPYPGVVRSPGGVVHGTLYLGVDGDAFRRLDRYEGPPYRRTEVAVVSNDAGRVAAWAYVIPERFRGMLSGRRWSPSRDGVAPGGSD